MWSKFNLRNPNRDERKKVIERSGGVWRRHETVTYNFKEAINRFHYTPATFKGGYRTGSNIIRGGKYILIDMDDPEAESIDPLLEKYEYFKAPSASATDEVDYKWHYFVRVKGMLSNDVNIARAQIQAFYDETGITGYDPTAIDPARYFAPAGAAEVYGTEAHRERVKWAISKTIHHKGKKYVPPKDVTPIYSGRGTPVSLDGSKLESAEPESINDHIISFKENFNGEVYKLSPDTPIFTRDGWKTASSIAAQLKDGESVSNYMACPVRNPEHGNGKKDAWKTIGYGYAERKDDTVFFSCGGAACSGNTHWIHAPLSEEE